MKKQLKEELVFLDRILEYAQSTNYIDFSKYDYTIDDIDEHKAEEMTSRDIQIIRDKIKKHLTSL